MQDIDEGIYLRALEELAWSDERLIVASTFRERLLGLMAWQGRGERGAPPCVVMGFPRCSSVHTFGMRMAIDIAFIDAVGNVLALYSGVESGHVCTCRGAAVVLERFSVVENQKYRLTQKSGLVY